MSNDRVWWYDAMGCDSSDTDCLDKWKTIHIAALIPSSLSILASIFIIITGILYHHKFTNMTFGAKLPIFISICDLLFEIMHGGDHLHNIITGFVSEDALCQLFGCMKPFSINCQTTWALAVALYLNRSVFNKSSTQPTFGQHNIYLHIFCWGVPLTILLFGFIFDVYGVEGPWCGVPDALTDILMVDMWMCLALFILIFNYSAIIYKLRNIANKKSDSNKEHSNNAAQKSNHRIKTVIRTIGLYPIAYFIQWLAYALYKSNAVEQTYETALWVVITANCGGIFNLFLYGPLLINQIKREQRKNEKMIKNNINSKQRKLTTTHTKESTVSPDMSVDPSGISVETGSPELHVHKQNTQTELATIPDVSDVSNINVPVSV
eukprot:321488_1